LRRLAWSLHGLRWSLHAVRAMVFTTNKPLASWARVLHDGDLAEAIIDRLLERGRLIELIGASYRTRHLRKHTDADSAQGGAIVSGKGVPEFPEPTGPERLAGTVVGARPQEGVRIAQGRWALHRVK